MGLSTLAKQDPLQWYVTYVPCQEGSNTPFQSARSGCLWEYQVQIFIV